MKINNGFLVNLGAPCFKGARINIVENSDNHGNLNTLPDFYNTIKQNGRDIFKKSDEPSTLNLYINAGDFFINPSKTGVLTYPNKTNGDVQRDFLELLIKKIGKIADTECYTQRQTAEVNGNKLSCTANFDALYTPGNHCFDGGDAALYKLLGSIHGLTTVMTNVNVENSPLLKDKMGRKNSKFVTKKEYRIDDDKDPQKKHHVMVLGATIPAMDFYNPGLIKGTDFIDKNDKRDVKMGLEDIKGTVAAIKKEVDGFKENHPKGIVILSSHMGTKLSKIIRDEVPGITEILDGHKHDIVTSTKIKGSGNGATISSLGQDNDIVKSISLIIDDEGDVEERESRTYSSDQYRLEKYLWKENALYRLLTSTYKKDYEPLVVIEGTPMLDSFDYKHGIRHSNSYLANFLTTSVKNSIKKIPGHEDIFTVGIQSSIIRGGIENGSNNFDVLKVFDGVSEDLSDVKVGKIKGSELVGMVLENIIDNLKDPERNTIIHWSDVFIARSGLERALKTTPELSIEDASKYITTRGGRGNAFDAEIKLDETYKIAIADKYLKKTDIKMPALIRDRFISINQTYNKLFKKYLDETDYKIKIAPEHMEDRVY